jgi:hypothetical protein
MVSNASDAQKAVMVSNVTGNVIVIEIKGNISEQFTSGCQETSKVYKYLQ